MPIRIAIADDHPMIITGLKNTISNYPNMVITGCYANGAELLKGLQQEMADVLLLDIQLPDKTGDQLATILLKKYPSLRILALTNFDSALYIMSMLRHGALGYLLKTTDEKTLIEAIETVYKGEEYLEESLRKKLEQPDSKVQRNAAVKIKLTKRQKQILELIVNGYTNQEIAEKLFLSLYTVENYRASILVKLNVKNTAMLVKETLTLGLLE